MVDRCTVSTSLGEHYMCVISACKSVIVSPYTPALEGTQNSPVLNLVHVLVVRICLTSVYYTSTFTDQTKLSL